MLSRTLQQLDAVPGANLLTVAMNPSDATQKTPATTQVASYANANGFSENYRVIGSKNSTLRCKC